MRSHKIWLPAVLVATIGLGACSIPGGSIPMPGSGGTGTSAGSSTGTSPLPIGTIVQAIGGVLNPNTPPAGSNNWNCKPSTAHPYPVVLVNGTTANMAENWVAVSPYLVNAGYCVYALNYGQTIPGPITATGDIAQSAQQLSDFVDKVLASTGASKVDFVGHSQGGMMPRYYIDFLGGAAKTNMLVGLAPSNHGTTILGLNALVTGMNSLFGINFSLPGCAACTEQLAGSTFLTNLNANGDTVPGPKYVVIESKYDEVVTPYTSAFLSGKNVQNITIQNQCPLDFSEHIGVAFDSNVLQYIGNALGPDSTTFAPNCAAVLPVLGNA